MIIGNPAQEGVLPKHGSINGSSVIKHSRKYFFVKLVQTVLLRPLTSVAKIGFRAAKIFVLTHGFRKCSAIKWQVEYLKVVRSIRDILFVPSVIKRTIEDLVASREEYIDDLPSKKTEEYLNVPHTKSFQQYSSYLHGVGTFEVVHPSEISEFAAKSDGALNTVMASHIFKPGQMAINFGTPNVATFVTEEHNGETQTFKVDAKSLMRAKMTYHQTNGKMQSGVFLVPTNVPDEAVARFKSVAEMMQGSKNITCVNTNCRVLKEAGFSIEGVDMDGIVFPGTLLEHLLFRNVFYTDLNGIKHKVKFDVLNTTELNLEEYVERVDTAVVGTRLRHRARNGDTQENKDARGAAGEAVIAAEKAKLAELPPATPASAVDLKLRKVKVSAPSALGDAITRIWGRHTMYEVDLSDVWDEIKGSFTNLDKLVPFPQKKPSVVTRLKRDIFFSGRMIRWLRKHMTARQDTIELTQQDLLRHLKSTKGARTNYALLDGKVVFGKVHANGEEAAAPRKAADWALSKHALLAGRQNVHCAGEIWYDEKQGCFMINDDSGTYKPTADRVKLVAQIANKIFGAGSFRAVCANPAAAA